MGKGRVRLAAGLERRRPAENSRHAHRFLPGLALQERALRSLKFAVIGSHQDDGVVALSDLIELLQQLADLFVETGHGGVEAGNSLPGPVLFGAGLPVLAQLDLFRIVHLLKARRRNVWIVRRRRLPVEAERLAALARFLQELDS